jgi:hypothetical protein
MKRHYELDGKAMYFIKSYEQDPRLLEMGFDLSAYQKPLQHGASLAGTAAMPAGSAAFGGFAYPAPPLQGRDSSSLHQEQALMHSHAQQQALAGMHPAVPFNVLDPSGMGLSLLTGGHAQQGPLRVYQTIFLDKSRKDDLWPLQEIDPKLVLVCVRAWCVRACICEHAWCH